MGKGKQEIYNVIIYLKPSFLFAEDPAHYPVPGPGIGIRICKNANKRLYFGGKNFSIKEKMMTDIDSQMAQIRRGAAEIIDEGELRKKSPGANRCA